MPRLPRLTALLKGQPRTRALGAKGERAAVRFLRAHAYKILARNLHLKHGEIDILALDPNRETLVVVEVKTRRATNPNSPRRAEDNITAHKKRKLLSLARSVARSKKWGGGGARPIRIDVIAVEYPPRGKPTIRHHTNAIRP